MSTTQVALGEELQVRYGYPGHAAHKEQHDKFRQDLGGLEQQFDEEGASLSVVIQTNQTMINWLLRHISGADRELAGFLHTAM